MELIQTFIYFVLHLNTELPRLVCEYQLWTYGILFAVIFAETGLVVTPFLPGDSLLFAAGAVAAGVNMDCANPLSAGTLALIIIVAAVLGDTVNYSVGRYFGHVVSRGIKPVYLEKTHAFYERHGGKTIILARFVPIVRTIAPFVAGVGEMTYRRFLAFNIVGGIAWPLVCIYAGVLFGGIPFVQKHFELVLVAIILISVLPMGIEYLRHRASKKSA